MIPQINYFSNMPKFLEKNLPRTKLNKTNSKLPIVIIPIVAYNTISDARKRATKIVSEVDKTKKTITDTTEANTKALKKAGVMKKDINKELDSNGELKNNSTKKLLEQKNISHKGSPEEDITADNAEIDTSETEIYTDSDTHSGFLNNIKNRFSDSLESCKEKVIGIFENIKDSIFNRVGEVKESTHNLISNSFKSSNIEIHQYSIKDIAANPELMNNMSIEEIKQIDVSMCPELEEFIKAPLDEVPDGLMDNILEDLPDGFGVGDETLYETLKGAVENATEMLG